jgi:NADH-quinone oxidoreductase subunit C
MVSTLANLADAVERRFGATLRRVPSLEHELSYEVEPPQLLGACVALRDEEPFRFEMLMDLCAVDYLHYGRDEWRGLTATRTGFSRGVDRATMRETPPDRPRFAVVYHLLSISHNQRLRLRTTCPDVDEPLVPSVVDVWASANWYEREAFDLYGILFEGHPDLRRILTDYGFIGHPFRKDFPLIGNAEVRYDPEKGRVVYEPVSIEPRTLVPKVIRRDNRYDPGLRDEASFKDLAPKT